MSGHDRAVTVPIRAILGTAAVLVFLAGLQLTVFPLRTADWFSWTIDPPMTAVFLGAAYWASAVLEVAGSRSADWGRARLTVWPVLVFTTLTLVVTLVHLDKFHLGAEQPASARAVTWFWLLIYAGVPVAMVVALALQARSRVPSDGSSGVHSDVGRLPAGLRRLLEGLAAVLLVAGVWLLLDPVAAAQGWPWPLTPLTGRAIGAWLVGLGWAAAQARLIDDGRRVRPLGLTGAAFVVLQLVALLRYGDLLDWSDRPALAYVAVLTWIALVSAWILALSRAGADRAEPTRADAART